MDRRSLVGYAIYLVGGAAFGSATRLSAARQPSRSKPISSHLVALLSSVCDTIMPKTDTPGALEAGVPKLVQIMLSEWASEERRAQIFAALDRIDSGAATSTGQGFVALPSEQRISFLARHDVDALRASQSSVALLPALPGDPIIHDPGYSKLKELIVILYYYSEAALTSELPYEHSPGAWQASIPVTKETRSWGGTGQL